MPTPSDDTTAPPVITRRAALKATAVGTAAISLGAGATAVSPAIHRPARAAENGGTRSTLWEEPASAAQDRLDELVDWTTVTADYPFYAIGAGWDSAIGTWPAFDFQLSTDGETWSETQRLLPDPDSAPAPKDNRLYTRLYFCNGESWFRYRTVDGEANRVTLDRLAVTYIDPTDGPWAESDSITMMMRTAAEVVDDDVPPRTIISRTQWGANDAYTKEAWPPEYQEVSHVIVHHAAASYGPDSYLAVRAIYDYHTYTQGWGDIGYNYVVGTDGRIFEGRYGGQNAIGGHAFQYANGSAGICLMGDFNTNPVPAAGLDSLAYILAWAARNIDHTSSAPFHELLNLPRISGHRDVNPTSCPGDFLYQQLPYLRNRVTEIKASGALDSGHPGGISPGDRVQIVPPSGQGSLPMRASASDASNVSTVPRDSLVWITQGPVAFEGANYYQFAFNGTSGWASGEFMVVNPPDPTLTDNFGFGINVQFARTTDIFSTDALTGYVATAAVHEWGFILAGSDGGNAMVRTQLHGDGWVPISSLALAPVFNPTDTWEPGTVVRVTSSGVPVRVRPGISQTIQGYASAGTLMTVSIAALSVTDRVWYGVQAPGLGGGWIDADSLSFVSAPTGDVPGGTFRVGGTVRASTAVSIRSGPGVSYYAIATLPTNASGFIVDGPRVADGYTWWKLDTIHGLGWVVQAWLVRTETIVPGTIKRGVQVLTTQPTLLKPVPTSESSSLAQLDEGTFGAVIAGPRLDGAVRWWQISTTAGVGWLPEPVLSIGAKFAVGDQWVTRSPVALRTTPVGSAIATLAAKTFGATIQNARFAGNRLWIRVTTSAGVGWLPQDWLDAGEMFPLGSQWRTRSAVALRTTPVGTVTVVLPAETYGATIQEAEFAGNRLWIRVSTLAGIGWLPQDWLTPGEKLPVESRWVANSRIQMRSVPAGPITQYLDQATTGVTTAAARFAGNRLWIGASSSSGDGWLPQDWLSPATRDSSSVGGQWVTTASAELLSAPGGDLRANLPAGTYGATIQPAEMVNGQAWIAVSTSAGTGWLQRDLIKTGEKFPVESQWVTDSRVGMRKTPAGTLVATLDSGIYGATIKAAQFAGNRLWILVSTSAGVGWLPQDWLVAGEKLPVNSRWVVRSRVAMRQAPVGTVSVTLGQGVSGVTVGKAAFAGNRLWIMATTDDGRSGWLPQDWLNQA